MQVETRFALGTQTRLLEALLVPVALAADSSSPEREATLSLRFGRINLLEEVFRQQIRACPCGAGENRR
jgi:hypothetical protein